MSRPARRALRPRLRRTSRPRRPARPTVTGRVHDRGAGPSPRGPVHRHRPRPRPPDRVHDCRSVHGDYRSVHGHGPVHGYWPVHDHRPGTWLPARSPNTGPVHDDGSGTRLRARPTAAARMHQARPMTTGPSTTTGPSWLPDRSTATGRSNTAGPLHDRGPGSGPRPCCRYRPGGTCTRGTAKFTVRPSSSPMPSPARRGSRGCRRSRAARPADRRRRETPSRPPRCRGSTWWCCPRPACSRVPRP